MPTPLRSEPAPFYLAGTLSPLGDADELAAFRRLRATEDPGLREELYRRNLRFVLFVCQRTKPYDRLWEEKVSGGMEGLLIALDRFDPERGAQFSSFAIHWIRQKAQEQAYGEMTAQGLGPKTHVAQRWAFWRSCQARLENLRLRAVSDEELVEWIKQEQILWNNRNDWWHIIFYCQQRLDWNPSLPDEMEGQAAGQHSLRSLQREEGLHTLQEVEAELERQDDRFLAEGLLQKLPPNMAQALRDQYGLDTGYPLTLEEIAQARVDRGGARVSKQAVSDLARRGLRRLQQEVAGHG